MVQVPHLPHRGVAIYLDQANLARGHLDMSVLSLFGHQLAGGTRAADELGPFARLHLDIMDQGSQGDIFQRQGISRFDIHPFPAQQGVSHLEFHRGQDIPFFSVEIMKQRDIRRPVGVIFDGSDLCGNVELFPFEIYDPVEAFMPAPDVPAGDSAINIPAPRLFQGEKQTSLRLFPGDLVEVQGRLKPSPR